ncbi:MAG: helix-hairpin-helix domain-containing protein [Anaerostipes sp.]|nr:helix-hairpin-helix domain-containing protein [Anaerostipes sp.]
MYKELKYYLIVFLLICGVFTGCSNHGTVAIQNSSQKKETTNTKKTRRIVVFVCGQVKKPGVYEFDSDERIVAAIKAAGGLTKKAAVESVNQAEEMKDGQQIYIPSVSHKKNAKGDQTPQGTDSGKVNINSASKEELMTLTGIGAAKAEDILSYRQEKGSFQKIQDIMKIQGIKEGVYNKIKDKITV